jgi:hypothetical protein
MLSILLAADILGAAAPFTILTIGYTQKFNWTADKALDVCKGLCHFASDSGDGGGIKHPFFLILCVWSWHRGRDSLDAFLHGNFASDLCRKPPAAIRFDRRRLQHELGHSRLPRRRRQLEKNSARPLPGVRGRRKYTPTLLGAQHDRLAPVRAGPAQRRASRACPP